MKTAPATALLAAFAVVAAACGTTGGPSTAPPSTSLATGPTITVSPTPVPFSNGDLIRLDIPRTATSVSPADIAAVVRGDIEMGFDVFQSIVGEDNVMISPYSIATALSMLYPGATGATANEIAEVLHLSVDDATLHAARNFIEADLSTQPPPPTEDDTRVPFAIRPANSVWGQGGYPFNDDYLAVLASEYGAGLRLLDFVHDPDGSTDLINEWVEDATEDRIKDLVPAGVIDSLTRLVLVNAIWFKANWAQQFDPAATTDGDFTRLDGSEVTVPLMRANTTTQYVDTGRFTALRLPYKGDAAMVIALPPSGVTPAQLAAQLTPADLDLNWGGFMVDITLPRFDFDSTVGLAGALRALGMTAAFDPTTADFGAITTGDNDLYLKEALHKSFIAVDETGTEAAAATALIVSATSLPPPATFTADRPFLFWIEHTTTGEMLFLGQVTDPS